MSLFLRQPILHDIFYQCCNHCLKIIRLDFALTKAADKSLVRAPWFLCSINTQITSNYKKRDLILDIYIFLYSCVICIYNLLCFQNRFLARQKVWVNLSYIKYNSYYLFIANGEGNLGKSDTNDKQGENSNRGNNRLLHETNGGVFVFNLISKS